MSSARETVALGEVLKLRVDPIATDATSFYPIAGVYSFGRGLFKRGPLLGSETTYKQFNRLHTGDIVLSQLKGWEGAIALVTPEFDGWYLSPQFPTFRVEPDRVEASYLGWFLRRKPVWDSLQRSARGIGARRDSVSPDRFLSIELPLPPLPEQRRIVAHIEEVASRIEAVCDITEKAETDENALLLSLYDRLVKGVERRPMRAVAPLVRRPVEIEPSGNYPELGIRCFGKGSFHKPVLKGAEVGSKQLYSIEPGDLVLSNVFAWEGAIAVAQPTDAGRVGSHRFITCVPKRDIVTSNFLCFHFLTRHGLEAIGKASPGGAGRNRTLGLEALAKIEVPVPPYEQQIWFDKLQAKIQETRNQRVDRNKELIALLPSVLDKAFRGEL